MRVALYSMQVPGGHSVHHPATPQAARVGQLADAMYVAAAVVFVLVVAALLWAAFRRRNATEPHDDPAKDRLLRTAVLLATGLTVVTLFAFLIADISAGRALTTNPGNDAIQVRVTGHQWWWEIQYRDSAAAELGHHRQRDPRPGRPARSSSSCAPAM